jgi:hypothetical protein
MHAPASMGCVFTCLLFVVCDGWLAQQYSRAQFLLSWLLSRTGNLVHCCPSGGGIGDGDTRTASKFTHHRHHRLAPQYHLPTTYYLTAGIRGPAARFPPSHTEPQTHAHSHNQSLCKTYIGPRVTHPTPDQPANQLYDPLVQRKSFRHIPVGPHDQSMG